MVSVDPTFAKEGSPRLLRKERRAPANRRPAGLDIEANKRVVLLLGLSQVKRDIDERVRGGGVKLDGCSASPARR